MPLAAAHRTTVSWEIVHIKFVLKGGGRIQVYSPYLELLGRGHPVSPPSLLERLFPRPRFEERSALLEEPVISLPTG